MEEPTSTKACALCGDTAPTDARYCRQCGKPFEATAPATPPKAKWYHNRWFVLLMLTPVVLGPLGLPLLWKSPNFSRSGKMTWTFITLGWTIAFVWYVMVKVVPAVMGEFNQLNSLLQP